MEQPDIHLLSAAGALPGPPVDNARLAALFGAERTWRQWVTRPSELMRPEGVDNSQFICEHGQLTFDPNISGDLDSSMTIIKSTDWDALAEL